MYGSSSSRYVSRMWRFAAISVLVLVIALPGRGDDDHDRARKARAAGDIVPLSQILEQVEATFDGRLVEVELENDDGRTVYEIELLTKQGSVIELTYDARTGRFLEAEGKGVSAARKQP